MAIRSYSFQEFAERVRAFHSYAAPGVIIGGFMVDLAYQHLSPEGLFDALCETPKCLPDAIQLLTPCTIGNGWLVVTNTGRFALTLYDKTTGEGVRVSVDAEKLEEWPEIKNWFFKLKPKKEQDDQRLMAEIEEAGTRIFRIQHVKVSEKVREKKHRTGFAVCPRCNEAYPLADGPVCIGCQGEPLWEATEGKVSREPRK